MYSSNKILGRRIWVPLHQVVSVSTFSLQTLSRYIFLGFFPGVSLQCMWWRVRFVVQSGRRSWRWWRCFGSCSGELWRTGGTYYYHLPSASSSLRVRSSWFPGSAFNVKVHIYCCSLVRCSYCNCAQELIWEELKQVEMDFVKANLSELPLQGNPSITIKTPNIDEVLNDKLTGIPIS